MTKGEKAGRESRDELFNERRSEIEKAGGTLRKLAKELVLIAFSDITDYIEVAQGGEVRAIAFDNIKKHKTRVIKKIREKRRILNTRGDGEDTILESTFELELYDKLDALKYLCKLRGDEPANKHELTGKDGGPILTKAVDLTDDELLNIARGSGPSNANNP
jgi:hypothetical protein